MIHIDQLDAAGGVKNPEYKNEGKIVNAIVTRIFATY